VLIVAYLVDGANITQDIQLFNPLPKPRFFGTEGLYDPSFLANGAGSVLNGFMGTTNAAPYSSPQYQYFAAHYLAGVGENPILFSETAYDAVYLMALAMQQGKANTRAALLANLRSVSNYSATPANDVVVGPGEWPKALQSLQAGKHVKYLGASGTIAWDANGDVTSGTYNIYRITSSNQAPSFDILKTVTFP
jgi:ABC-type branched-subunit amino acid transport system substrate-binding protein